MKTNLNHNSWRHLMGKGNVLMVATLLIAAGWCSSCQDEGLDEKLPPNFGSNLMTHLEGNNFTTYAQLAQDLGYVNALSGVSLKTLLAADDEAFERFFKGNPWGVKSYAELTTAQKKLLFYNSMLDNSLQVLNLSSTSGNGEALAGNAMRRSVSGSVYDTVPVIYPDEMPDNNSDWDYYRNSGKAIVCMKDMTTRPVMFFVEPFLKAKGITNTDIDFMYNFKNEPRQTGDANVGNTYIEEGNVRCPNGFVHKLHDVLVPLDNMSEVIRKHPKTRIFSRILERFSAPFYAGDDPTRDYNHEYGTEIDSLFEKRYYATRSKGGEANIRRPNNGPEVAADEILRFDPGWNGFYSDQKGADPTVSLQSNMGVMMVPSDKAMEDYWNGAGKAIRDYFHEYDNVPNYIWAELINNGMLNSWVNSVPSKFDGIVNSNQDPMGLKNNDTSPIDSVLLACNGAIYLTNQVFAPTSFRSVSFPTLVNDNMSIFRWAIKRLEYRSYLNSLDSYYSFFIPTNTALLVYYNPLAYAGTNNQLWRFHYKADAESDDQRVWATVYNYDLENNVIGDSIGKVTDAGTIADRLEDLLDTHIIIGNEALGSNVENGHDFYRTKNGGIIRVKKENGDLYVQGTFQRDQNKWLKITEIYDQMAVDGNGKTYILDGDPEEAEPIMTTRKSSFDALSEHEEFSMFNELLLGSPLLEMDRNQGKFFPASDAGNMSCFNNFNYTIYVPTNESLKAVFADKAKYNLYTWEEIGKFEEAMDLDPSVTQAAIDEMKSNLEAFLRYHIQDNLLMIGLDYSLDGGADYDENGNLQIGDSFTRKYETANMNEETQKFYTLEVHCEPGKIEITDQAGNTRHVLNKQDAEGNDLYNITVRDYLLDGSISASSFAAIHLIDGPLLYKK